MPEPVVWAQTLDGVWIELGVGADRAVVPESLTPAVDRGGPSTFSFSLRRKITKPHLDLAAFTPAFVEVDGRKVWAGRIREAPITGGGAGGDSIINVQAQGWQEHLDNDQFATGFVHTSLADFVDTRTKPGVGLANKPQHFNVQAAGQGGAIQISNQRGVGFGAGTWYGAVTLDLGPAATARRFVITVDVSGMSTNYTLAGYTHSAPDPAAGASSTFFSVNNPTAGTYAGTLAGGGRYVSILLIFTIAAAGSFGADEWIRVNTAQVFTNPAYESGNASILKASDVIKAALPFAPLLSQDTSKISATAFSIPDFMVPTPQTPRQVIARANSYHQYQVAVDVERQLTFRPYPSVPLLEVKDAAYFDDASASSGEDVFNKVIIDGATPDGTPLLVTVTSSQLAGARFMPLVAGEPSSPNPSFDTVVTNWATTNGGGGASIVRDTVVADSAPASGKWTIVTAETLTHTLTGTFKAGRTYRATIAIRSTTAGPFAIGVVKFGSATDFAQASFGAITSSSFKRYSIVWTPTVDSAAVTLQLTQPDSPATYNVDSLVLERAIATLPDRRGFLKTQNLSMQSPTTTVAMTNIATAWLTAHKVAPLKGSLHAERGVVTLRLGGREVDPSELLFYYGELVLFSSLIDPDTGQRGRVGVLDSASLDVAGDSASVNIDNNRDNLAAMLSRMNVVSGVPS